MAPSINDVSINDVSINDVSIDDVQVRQPERPASTLIRGGAVVTIDDDFTIHEPGWVHVEGDRIAGVGPGEPPPGLASSVERVVEATGGAVMPGMTNGHTHLFQTFFRGLADDRALLDWLHDCIWPGAVHIDDRSARLAALVGMAENVRGGATSVLDHQYVHLDAVGDGTGVDDAVCVAADEVGVRYLMARGWADRNYEPMMTESAEVILERTDHVRQRWHGHDDDRIRIELAPLIPWGCSDDAMRATTDAANRWNAGTHIHCAETKVEVEMSLEERGLRHVPWLDQLGALGPNTQLAHSVWLDDDELDLIADRGALVVHCPVSNMYLASGVARILDMRERGIPIALASDGPGSNNRQDMFEVLKATALLQKVHRLDPIAVQPEEVLTMACRGGARALGLAEEIGAIEVGRKADVLVVDLRSVFIAPVHRVASALVFNAMPSHLSHVLIDGRVVLDEGELTMLDERALVAAAQDAARDLFDRAGLTVGPATRP